MGVTVERLHFVERADVAPAPAPGTRYVVLDAAWTGGDGERPDLVPLLPAAAAVAERIDLFEDALERLDAWAETAGMIERLVAGRTSYSFRLREPLWHWLHERLLWRHVIAELAGSATVELRVPPYEPALADVARAIGAATGVNVLVEEAASAGAHPARTPGITSGTRNPLRRWLDARSRSGGRDKIDRRASVLGERLARLSAEPQPRILVISHSLVEQRVSGAAGDRLADPNLGPVVERLEAAGFACVVVGIGLHHRDDETWRRIEANPALLPVTVLQALADATAEGAAPAERDRILDDLDSGPAIPLDVDGIDLGPALRAEVRSFAAGRIEPSLRQTERIRALLRRLEPSAQLLSHEGNRTDWLVAAEREGIPTFAVQHGVLYPSHPGYRHPRHPMRILPTRTFVFGDYERDVLVAHAGYEPDEVAATGAPRLDLDSPGAAGPTPATERAAVRHELGVANGDRLLVVSTNYLPLSRRFYLAPMLARLLGGPLPGVHVVFKQHPAETDDGGYEALVAARARSGGYAPPPMSTVRDVDLYRLLRAADAHLGLHSTVLTDAVVTGTTNLVAVDQAHRDLLAYVAAGVAIPVASLDEVRAALADPRPLDPEARQAFLDAHFRPGGASARIVEAIAGHLDAGVTLRPATREDAALLLAWANDPETRAASFQSGRIDPVTHDAWLEQRLADTTGRLWIGLQAGRPIGQVRVDLDASGDGEIGISVEPEARGRGLSRPLLEAALVAAGEELGPAAFVAYVRPDNARSLALFAAAGFTDDGSSDHYGTPARILRRAGQARSSS